MVAPVCGGHPELMPPLVVLSDASARVGSTSSLAIGDHAADWEDTAGAESHAFVLEWERRCQARTKIRPSPPECEAGRG